ncbi:MAG: DUF4034 domain-containing protein [Betaproteobacteria bacterium]|nr:MAG: DUF4034 domain-containing protein [Betaproteobacteria bacterium]
MKCVLMLATALLLSAGAALAGPAADLRYPWDSRPDSCFVGTPTAKVCELDSWSNQRLMFDRLRMLWRGEQFALFERALLELSHSSNAYANGYPQYDSPFVMLDNDVLPNNKAKLERWQIAVPDSLFAHIAESILERNISRNIRGNGFASTVTDETWALVEQHLKTSEAILLSSAGDARDLEAWHHSLLATSLLRTKPQSNPAVVFETAVKRWPKSYGLYELMAYFMLPKYRGSWTAVEHFAKTWSAEIPDDGDTFYFRLYFQLRREPKIAGIKPTNIGIDYPHLKQSGMEMIKRYPQIAGYKAGMASFACAFGDRPTFLELVEQLPASELTSNAWLTSYSSEVCSQGAQTPPIAESPQSVPLDAKGEGRKSAPRFQ